MSDSTHSTDPFARFWRDMAANFAPPQSSGFGETAWAPSEQALRQMRQIFFDSWEKSCQEFMGSEQFLKAMKQSMDGALAFREQMNQFLQKALDQSPLSSQADNDSVVGAIRQLENRVVSEMEKLERRVTELESKTGKGGAG